MKKLIYYLFVLTCYSTTAANAQVNFKALHLKNTDGIKVDFSKSNDTYSVFVFLSPECPLSQQYTISLNKLQDEFIQKKVLFFGVIPGKFYNTDEINSFQKKYSIRFQLIPDRELNLQKLLKASITPEVFIVDSNYSILYSGAIDNGFLKLGKKQIITHRYLWDALESITTHTSVRIKHSQAIGCFIE